MSRAVKPRIAVVPPASYSDGVDAVRLAASAGLVLDPWQAWVMEQALGVQDDGQWSAFEVGLVVGRQNGKGALLEARELFGLFLVEDERLILHSAHEFKTAAEAFRRVLGLVEGCPDLRKQVKKVQIGHGDEGIELRDGSRLRFVARSTGSGRGFTGDLIILDEAYALTDKQMEALLPTLSARPNPQLWYTSTPPLDPIVGAQLMAVRRRAVAGGERLAYFEYSAPGDLASVQEIDLDDRALWAASNPALGIRISEEFIERERHALTDEGFARERLCVFPSTDLGARVLPGWGNLFVNEVPPPPAAVGLAVSLDSAWGSIASADLWDDHRVNLSAVDRRPGTAWLVGEASRIQAERGCGVVVDEKCPDGTLVGALEDAGVDVQVMRLVDLVAACSELVNRVRECTVTHQRTTELDAAIDVADWRDVGDGRRVFGRRKSSGPVDMLEAATAAMWGALNGSPVPAIYGPEPVAADEPVDRLLAQADARQRRREAVR